MELKIKEDGVWYHGSNLIFDTLRTGSTITQWRELAEAFSHQPSRLSYDDDGIITHNGTEPGYLYIIDEPIKVGVDVISHPRTTMSENAEFLVNRPLKLKLIENLGSFISNRVFSVTAYELTDSDRNLISAALEVISANFDAVHYNHTVGCALRCKNGNIYRGVNCDGIHGSCAEYITIGAAISAGEREFDTIVAVHEGHPNNVIPPCGNCRQMLFEYCPDIKVIINDSAKSLIKVSAADLLPFS